MNIFIDDKVIFDNSFKKNISKQLLKPNLISSLSLLSKTGCHLIRIKDFSPKQGAKKKLTNSWLYDHLEDLLSREGITFTETISKEDIIQLANSTLLSLVKSSLKKNFLITHSSSLSKHFPKNFNIEILTINPSSRSKHSFKNWSEVCDHLLSLERKVTVERNTKETKISIELNLDGKGRAKIKTGLGFFDHMLENFCKHSGVDLKVLVDGDLEVDEHHTIEDTALALGECFKKALGNKLGITRYGFVLPMDESEVACSIDFSGRSHLEWETTVFKREFVGDFPTEMLHHFYNSFCMSAGLNMNMKIQGENEHHMIEASFKSLAKCIKQAIARQGYDMPSTKGVL